MKMLFHSTESDVIAAMRKCFDGCSDIKILGVNVAEVKADAEYVSASVGMDFVSVGPGEARVVLWEQVGKVRDVRYGIVAGVVPRAMDPFSADASSLTLNAVMRAIKAYNLEYPHSINTARLLADYFVTPGSDRILEQSAALRATYDEASSQSI